MATVRHAVDRRTAKAIRQTAFWATIAAVGVLVVQLVSVAHFGFTSPCGKAYMATIAVMGTGFAFALFLARRDPARAVVYVCYIALAGICGMAVSHCATGGGDFPDVVTVPVCGVLVLRWSRLKRQTVVYGLITAVAIALVALMYSHAMGAAGSITSIVLSVFPREKV
jgi:hypothetical protein